MENSNATFAADPTPLKSTLEITFWELTLVTNGAATSAEMSLAHH